jgi:hypothetical protein
MGDSSIVVMVGGVFVVTLLLTVFTRVHWAFYLLCPPVAMAVLQAIANEFGAQEDPRLKPLAVAGAAIIVATGSFPGAILGADMKRWIAKWRPRKRGAAEATANPKALNQSPEGEPLRLR